MDETLKFKYGDLEYDPNKVALYLHDNLDNWLNALGFNEKDREAVRVSIGDMIGRILSGDINQLDYSGNAHSLTDFTNNGKLKHLINFPNGKGIIRTGKVIDSNGNAVRFLNEAMTYVSESKKEKDNSKELYSHDKGLHKAFLDRFFGGQEVTPENIESVWYSLDNLDDEGNAYNKDSGKLRSRNNRLLQYANFIEEYINSDDINNYDYSKSAFKDLDTYKDRLRAAANAARSGDYTAFEKAYIAAGGNDQNILFNQGVLKEKEKSAMELAWEDFKNNHIPSDATPEEIALYRKEFEDNWKYENYSDYYNNKYEREFNEFANNNWTNSGSVILQSLGTTPWTQNDKDFWLGNGKELDEDGAIASYFSDENHVRYAKSLLDKVLSGSSISGVAPKSGKNNTDILRAYMYALKGTDDWNSETTQIDKNSYFINSSFDINTGSGIKYDFNKRLFIRVYVDPIKTPKLAAALSKKWQLEHPRQVSSNRWKLQKGGSIEKLRKLKLGDNINAVVESSKRRFQQQQEASIAEEMSRTGKSRDQVLVGHSKALSSKDRLSTERGVEEGLNNSDITRLITAGVDLASIPVSYIPGGNVVAGIMGVGTMAADMWADATDDSVTSELMWGNLGINAGLTGLSLIGGGVAKTSKIAKTIVKLLPTALAVYGASLLLQDKDFQKSFNKLKDGDFTHFTTNDVKNISAAIKLVAGGHNATKSAAGQVGVGLAKAKPVAFKNTINSTGRGLSRWGNNDFISTKKTSRLLAIGNSHPEMLTSAQRAHLQNLALLESGGFESALASAVKKGNKYVLRTTNGELEVEGSVYKAMLNAYSKYAKKPNVTQAEVDNAVKLAYTEEMTRLGKLTPSTETISSGKPNLGEEAKIKEFFKAENKPESGKTIELAISEHGAGTTKLKINASQFEALAKAYEDGGIDGLNAKYTELFPNTTRQIAPNMPQFVIPEITSRSVWNPLRWISRPTLGGEESGTGWWGRNVFNSEYDPFDINTVAGKHNVNLLRQLRQYDNPNSKLASDVEYNNGLAGFLGFKNDYSEPIANLKHQINMEEYANRRQVKLQDASRADKVLQLMFDRELSKTTELASWSSDAVNSHLSEYAQNKGLSNLSNLELLKSAKKLAIDEGRSLKSVLRNPTRKPNPRDLYTSEKDKNNIPNGLTQEFTKLVGENPDFLKLTKGERALLLSKLESLKPALGLDKNAKAGEVIKAFLNKKGDDTIPNAISKLIGENKTLNYLRFSKSGIAGDLFKELKQLNPTNTKSDRIALANNYHSVMKRVHNLYKRLLTNEELNLVDKAVLDNFKSSGKVELSIPQIKEVLGNVPKTNGTPNPTKAGKVTKFAPNTKEAVLYGNAGNVAYKDLSMGTGKNKITIPVIELKEHIVETKNSSKSAYGAAYQNFKNRILSKAQRLTADEVKKYKKLFGSQLKTDVKSGWVTSLGKLIFEKQGGKLEKLQQLKSFIQEGTTSFKNGGVMIPKALNAAIQPALWYLSRYLQHVLGGESDQKSKNQFAGNTIVGNNHNEDFTLGRAFFKNLAYTSNSDLVGLDINTYYENAYNGKSLADYVTGYNSDAAKIRGMWGIGLDGNLTNTSHYANTTKGMLGHNQLHRAMFHNRNNTSGHDYSIGYQAGKYKGYNVEDTMGTSTWMRRMDLYEKGKSLKELEGLTDDELKHRIHKVGNLGYVFKLSNGNIEIVDDDTLKRLGIIGNPNPNDDLKPQLENPNPAVSPAIDNTNPNDPEGGIASPAGGPKEVSKKSKKSVKTLKDLIDPYAIALLTLGLGINKLLEKLGLDKRIALEAHTDKTIPIIGNFIGYLLGIHEANQIADMHERLANNTSDYSTAAGIITEGFKKYADRRRQALADWAAPIELTRQLAMLQSFSNVDLHDKDRNENLMRKIQKYNHDRDIKSARLSNDFAGMWKPWWMLNSAELDFMRNKKERLNLAYIKERLNAEMLAAIAKEKEAYNADPNNEEKLNAYVTAMRKYSDEHALLYRIELLEAQGMDASELRNILNNLKKSTVTMNTSALVKLGGKLLKLKTLKSGGSAIKDDGPVKTRSKDLDRFYKTLKQASDSHDKKLARLAAATLVELKRTMGK